MSQNIFEYSLKKYIVTGSGLLLIDVKEIVLVSFYNFFVGISIT